MKQRTCRSNDKANDQMHGMAEQANIICPACVAQDFINFSMRIKPLTPEIMEAFLEPKLIAMAKETDGRMTVKQCRDMVMGLAQIGIIEQAVEKLSAAVSAKKDTADKITPVSVSVDHKTGKVLVH